MTAELDDRRERSPSGTGTGEELTDLADDPHCRSVVAALRDLEEPVPVSLLARRVVGAVTDTPPSEVPDDAARRAATWLHHGQLPALEERGAIEFDADAELVRLADGS